QVLRGELPFRGNTRMLLHQVLHDEPRPRRSLNDHVPRDLQTVCLKCLEKDPKKRYASARALADDLHAYLDGRPVQARPVGRLGRLWRRCRRNPAVAALSAALLLTLALGFAAARTWPGSARRIRRPGRGSRRVTPRWPAWSPRASGPPTPSAFTSAPSKVTRRCARRVPTTSSCSGNWAVPTTTTACCSGT